jgi:hypothetical protein
VLIDIVQHKVRKGGGDHTRSVTGDQRRCF